VYLLNELDYVNEKKIYLSCNNGKLEDEPWQGLSISMNSPNIVIEKVPSTGTERF